MKQNALFISGIFLLSAAIVGGFVFLRSDSPTQQVQDSRDLDILNVENLTREINAVRKERGLAALQENSALKKEMREVSERAGTGKIDAYIRSNEIVIYYDDLSGEAPREFYSTKGFINWLLEDPNTATILLSNAKEVGVWVTYVAETETSKPIPWVGIIVR